MQENRSRHIDRIGFAFWMPQNAVLFCPNAEQRSNSSEISINLIKTIFSYLFCIC